MQAADRTYLMQRPRLVVHLHQHAGLVELVELLLLPTDLQ
jgi:hypothetical protein